MDLAFVLVATPTYPDAARLAARARELGVTLTAIDDAERDMYTFAIAGGGTAIYALMPVPDPDAATMPTGPTAATPEEIATQKAHFIVSGLELPGDVEQRDLTMARLTAALIDTTDAIGAKLGHGVVFHKAGLFAEMVAEAVEDEQLPPELAVDITVAPEPGERMSFLTNGMERYGREDLYVTCPIQGKGALGFVFDLTRWLLTDRDKHLPTGDTLGRDANEKIRIQRVDNPRGRGAQVIRLDLAS